MAFDDGTVVKVEGDWTPGDRLTRAVIDGQPLSAKVDMLTEGFRIRYRGADLTAIVRTPRAAALAALMPEKLPPTPPNNCSAPCPAW